MAGTRGKSEPVAFTFVSPANAREGEGRPQVIEAVLVHQADFAAYNPLVMLQKGSLIV